MMFKVPKLSKAGKDSANISRTIRFTEDLFDEYNRIAEETGVSFNSLVLSAMKYALNNLEIVDENVDNNNEDSKN
ncbi:MAG: hypothetical protein IKD77_05650 [Bacilli bacterium]|nr:hypothetical protein [Bacilli bacterium]